MSDPNEINIEVDLPADLYDMVLKASKTAGVSMEEIIQTALQLTLEAKRNELNEK